MPTDADVWGESCEESPFSPPVTEIERAVTGKDDDESLGFVAFDIETGPRPEPELRTLYTEPTYEEFAAACDARWKEETKRAKFEERKAGAWNSFVSRAALDATTGRVVAIGIVDGDGPRIIDCDEDEAAGLAVWWRTVSECLLRSCPIVGFNLFHFDLPFLVRRSWILGVPVPAIRAGRYYSAIFKDLMEVWQQGGRELVSLDTLAKAFGVAPKVKEVNGVAVSGAEFHRVWRENRPAAEAYLKRDLEIPAALAVRMGVV